MAWILANPLLTFLAADPGVRQTWPGSINHLGAVLVSGIAIFLLIQGGLVMRFEGREAAYRRVLGVGAVLIWLGINGWYALPAQFDLAETLPLHICDLGNLLAGVLFLLPRPPRVMRSVLYFWAFALTIHGFITPVVEEGPASPGYWLFWLNHGVVVGCAIYDLVVLGFRPTWRDGLSAAAVTAGYVAVILPINLLGGWNYGFVGAELPEVRTVIHALGPWPGRVFLIAALGAVAFILVWLPWPIARWLGRSHGRRNP